MQKNKITILFICPYPQGQAPSQRFRFEQYFDLLRQNNFYVQTSPFLSPRGWSVLYQRGKILQKMVSLLRGFLRRGWMLLWQAPRFDIIFIHREAAPLGPPFIEWVLACVYRKKVIYDFDDAIWIPATSRENRLASFLKMTSKVGRICRWSTVVSCGNQYLCDYARQFNPRTVLNPTTVDTEGLHNPELYPSAGERSHITIGWTGSHSTLQYLEALVPVIRELADKSPRPIRFVVVADQKPVIEMPGLVFIPWSKENEIRELAAFDIGVMPLTDDPWAKGKCGFKIIQYLALGIPAVASPVGVNTTIIEDGVNGYLCTTPSEWEQALVRLLADDRLRKSMGESGRKKIVQRYSLTSNSGNFLSLFS